jgi:hypothetical protein
MTLFLLLPVKRGSHVVSLTLNDVYRPTNNDVYRPTDLADTTSSKRRALDVALFGQCWLSLFLRRLQPTSVFFDEID